MNYRLAAAPLLIAAVVAACSGASTPSATTAPATAPASVAASAAPSTAASQAAASSTDTSGGGYGSYKSGGSASAGAGSGSGGITMATTSLGSVLVGPNGKTLYMFTPDTATTSACSGTCAATWPPLTGTMPSLGTGLNASDFGTVTRADGTTQISFHGHPLYYYGGDQAPGDTKGQGLFQKWYVLGADGNPMK